MHSQTHQRRPHITTVSNALEQQDTSPTALVRRYKDDITAALPSHINHDQWLSVVFAALKDPNIAKVAQANPGSLFNALRTASRLGLEPATEQYYLVPQGNQIIGVVGWQGMVELIYRAGAVSSVIAEVVYDLDDFDYQPGLHDRPIHKIDWKAQDRGRLALVYAYAIMKDGATSKVVVLNNADIAKIKQSSASASHAASPWKKHEPAMWLKSAVRQLAKWVPTSSEYRREQLRAAQEIAAEQTPPNVNQTTGEVFDDGAPIDGELVD